MKDLKIKLKKEERKFLQDFLKKGTKKARAIARANILLLADEGWETNIIAKMVKAHRQRIWRTKKRFLEEGLKSSLEEKSRSGQPIKYTKKHEAEIIPEYLKRMYDILDLYQEPYNPKKPVIGFDEKPKQLLGEKRMPIPLQPGKIEKYDYEYIRNGKANIFVAVEPKGGKRTTKVTRRRTKKDFALYIKEIILG